MLLQELDRVFSEVSYPGDQALADAYPNEWEKTLQKLQGKDWRKVSVADFDSQGGMIEGIQALSQKGFVYFLPGLLRLVLTQPEHRYLIVSALLTFFTRPEDSKLRVARQDAIILALSTEQRDFMARFFIESLEMEETLCPVLVESAVTNLRNGQITPFKNIEIEKWVANLSGFGQP